MIFAGDIVLVRNRGLIAWLIRVITKSPYDHIGIFSSPSEVIEAKPKGVLKSDFADCIRDRSFVVYRLKNEKKFSVNKAIAFAESFVGDEYDFFQIFKILFKFLFKRKRNDNNRAWTCSELVAEAYREGGIKVNKNLDYATPGTFWRSELFAKAE